MLSSRRTSVAPPAGLERSPAPGSTSSLLVHRLVQVQQRVRHHRPGGALGARVRWRRRPATARPSSGSRLRPSRRRQPRRALVARGAAALTDALSPRPAGCARKCASCFSYDATMRSISAERGRARRHQAEAERGAVASRRAALVHHPAGQRARRLEERLVVQRRERLQRRVGADAAHRAELAARGVEGDEARVRRRAADERVEAAAVPVFACARDPLLVAVRVVPDALGLRREDARAADLRAEQARSPRAPRRAASRLPCGSAGRARAGGCRGRARAARA